MAGQWLISECVAICLIITLNGTLCQCASYEGYGLEFPQSSGLKCGHVCPGEGGWKTVPLLWAPLSVKINCSTSSYKVLEAASSKALIARNATVIQWCGWEHILKDPRVCQFSLSPLRDHYLAVDPDDTSSFFNVGSPGLSCEVSSMRELSLASMCLTLIGVMLYYNARRVSMSTYFRLSSGTVLFVTGAAAVLAFIMMRNIPYRRSLAAFFAVSTSSLFAVMRWVYGTWLPNMHSVIYSRPFLIYLLVSGLVGLALTYWMDDTSNVKINTTIRVGLNLLGLLLVYFGISDERWAVGAVLLLVAGPVMLTITRALGSTVWWIWRKVFGASRYLAARSKAASRTGRTAGSKAARNRAGLAGSTAAAALVENEPLLSDEEPEGRAFRSTGRRRSRQQPEPVQLPPDGRQLLDKLPSLDNWVQPQHPVREPSPLHLRTPPPDSPYLRQPHRMVQQRKNLQQQMLPQNLRDRAGESSPDAAYKFPTSGSPWSSEKVALDISARHPQSVSPPHGATAVAGRDAAAAAFGQPPADAAAAVSPLIRAGKIINPQTGKAVFINKAKYNELISQGYRADLVNGMLIPPGTAAAAVAGSGSVDGSDAVQSRAEAAARTRRRSTRQDGYSPLYS